jgi:hypothetical protein
MPVLVVHKGSPHRPDHALIQRIVLLLVTFVGWGLMYGAIAYCAAAALGISRQAISQMKPTSSRAMATHTTFVFLPD